MREVALKEKKTAEKAQKDAQEKLDQFYEEEHRRVRSEFEELNQLAKDFKEYPRLVEKYKTEAQDTLNAYPENKLIQKLKKSNQ